MQLSGQPFVNAQFQKLCQSRLADQQDLKVSLQYYDDCKNNYLIRRGMMVKQYFIAILSIYAVPSFLIAKELKIRVVILT